MGHVFRGNVEDHDNVSAIPVIQLIRGATPADRTGKDQKAIRDPRKIPNSAAAQLHIDNIFVRNVRAIEPLFENWHVIGAQQRVVKSDMHDPIADCNPFDIHVVFLTR